MKTRTADLVTALAIVALCALLLLQLKNIPREGTLFPAFVLWMLIACSVCLAGRALLHSTGTVSFFNDVPPKKWLMVCGIFLLQVLGILFISFKLCMFTGMLALLCLLTPHKTPKAMCINVLVSVFFVVFFQLFFTDVMHIYFPEPLFE